MLKALLQWLRSVFTPVIDFDVYVNQVTDDRHISYNNRITLCGIHLDSDIHIRDNFSENVLICTACVTKLNPTVLKIYAELTDEADKLHEYNTLVQ